ncbi:isoprenylcysteine carboxylmethyltransferase family protein [Candidatus Woesearchaeota archaeon]|nr:isoprenylcysteine carboxylmethyltransferase family protein [Candidatus Woesearchaeota archaeon]
MKIKPPFIALYYLVCLLIINYVFPTQKIFSKPLNYSGIIFIVLGISLIVWAAISFKKQNTPKDPFKKPTAVVVDGPFRYSRNPMYLGLTTVLLGTSFLNGSWLILMTPTLFIITIQIFFIPMEETKMENLFGTKYLDYKSKVRRWI